MTYIGIDPGRTGAFALLSDTGDLLEVVDMPVVDKKVSPALVGRELARLARERGAHAGTIACEDVHAMPGEGRSSVFSFGRSLGIVLGAAATIASIEWGWRLARPTPQEWKRHHHLIGRDDPKEAARALALDLWPHQADLFRFKTKDGRADAALIALWAKENDR